MANSLVVTELHYHRNGIGGTGYYAGRAHWRPDRKTLGFPVMFAAFIRGPDDNPEYEAEGHVAIMGDNNVEQSFRFEDFDADLRKFIFSRAGQFMAFPHTLVRA